MQTGIQEQIEIGNDQESYNRFPLQGINNWQTAAETFVSAGIHSMTWKRMDRYGCNVSPGSYFFRLEAGENVASGKFIAAE